MESSIRTNAFSSGDGGSVTIDAAEVVVALERARALRGYVRDADGAPVAGVRIIVRPGGLILGHDMHRPMPDPRYIEAITTNPDLDTSFIMMESFGISMTLKKR